MNINKVILDFVEQSFRKLTPPDLQKAVLEKYDITRKAYKEAIRELIGSGELVYTYIFGNSYLEKSFNRAVRVSKKVVLVPEGLFFNSGLSDDIVVFIRQGAAFGTGAHPTTRLAIRGIEKALTEVISTGANSAAKMLDIGTGSGVLAISALKMGIRHAVAMDLDPCARKEAAENALLNGLEKNLTVFRHDLCDLHTKFFLITANLRYPTLIDISGEVSRISDRSSRIVFSGFRPDEFGYLIKEYMSKGFVCKWSENENNWTGALFLKQEKDL